MTEVRRAARFGAAALLVVALGVVAGVAARAGPDWALSGSSLGLLLVELASAAALVGAGIVVYVRGPDGRSGLLLASAGLLRLVAEWNNPDGAPGAFVFTVGLALAAAATGPLAHALLVHGSGRLRDAPSWLAATTVYLASVVLLGVAPTLVADPRAEGCPACPTNLLRVTTQPHLEARLQRWGLVLLVGALALTIIVVLVRLTFASSAQRRLVAPVVIPGCLTLAFVAADGAHSRHRGFLSNDPVERRLWLLEVVSISLVVAGVLWQRLAARRFRAALTRVVVELADSPRPGGLRGALADALGEPGLELLHAHGGGWIDSQGRTRRLPEPRDVARTELARDGRVVAALVHRRGLLDDPVLVQELERTAGLALEHDRLNAELLAQLAYLRISRAQVVAVGDTERRRLERDLHDGAQQALAALAMGLGVARANTTDRTRAERLSAAQDAVRAALAELRAMAHRISPAALGDAGLAAALDVLAEWAPQLEVAHVPAERFDPAVESAAYFVVASLASTVSGRIVVDARCERDTLLLDVRVAKAPGALIELEDRIEVLDGRLLVEQATDGGSVVRIWLPCAS